MNNNIINRQVKNVEPYTKPDSKRTTFAGLRLDFNEKTVPPSKKVQEAIIKLAKSNTFQLYPDSQNLESEIARYCGVQKDQILITNGSDQAIDIVFRTFTTSGDNAIIPTPSFAMFERAAKLVGTQVKSPEYKKDTMEFPLNETIELINDKTKIIVLCNPNNPTGTTISLSAIQKIAQNAKNAVVLVDEAYYEFSGVTIAPYIQKFPNIIVVRTMSKAFGLASLRIGYAIAEKSYISEMSKVRGPFDVNMAAIVGAKAALNDLPAMKSYVNEIMNKSKPLVESFFKQSFIKSYPSKANFILYEKKQANEEVVLKKNGVLVRSQKNSLIKNTIRVSIGTKQQMQKFISIYEKNILQTKLLQKYAFIDRDGTLLFEPQDTYQIDSIEKFKLLDAL